MHPVLSGLLLVLVAVLLAIAAGVWIETLTMEKQPIPNLSPPVFLGTKVQGDGNVCAIFSYEANETVSVVVEGNVYVRECRPEDKTCAICVPAPARETVATFTFGAFVARVLLPPATATAYAAAISAPLSWDVNVETNVAVTLCNDTGDDATVTLTVSDDGNAIYSNPVTVPGNACTSVDVLWKPSYTGTHRLTASAGGRSVSTEVFVGEHLVDYAPTGGGVRVFEVQEAVTGGGAKMFETREALSGGGVKVFEVQEAVTGGGAKMFETREALSGGAWDCPDDLNKCFATDLE